MKDWLIKALGGYTKDMVAIEMLNYKMHLLDLSRKLKQAKKNDTPRDPKTGRFIKK